MYLNIRWIQHLDSHPHFAIYTHRLLTLLKQLKCTVTFSFFFKKKSFKSYYRATGKADEENVIFNDNKPECSDQQPSPRRLKASSTITLVFFFLLSCMHANYSIYIYKNVIRATRLRSQTSRRRRVNSSIKDTVRARGLVSASNVGRVESHTEIYPDALLSLSRHSNAVCTDKH